MVSLTDRSAYARDLRENAKFNLFYSFINGLPIENGFDISISSDEIIFNAVSALLNNGEKSFQKNLNIIAEREPNSNSPFTNDDILLFVMVCGIKKFGLDDSWIRKILKARLANDNEGQLIKTTFQNLVDNNYIHNGNAYEMIIPLEEILQQPKITTKEKRVLYGQLVHRHFPFYKSDFLNILALRSFDLILISEDPSEEGALFRYRTFESKFIKRVRTSAMILFGLVSITIFIGLIRLGFDRKYTDTITRISSIVTLAGYGLFSLFKRDWVLNLLQSALEKIWGYQRRAGT